MKLAVVGAGCISGSSVIITVICGVNGVDDHSYGMLMFACIVFNLRGV